MIAQQHQKEVERDRLHLTLAAQQSLVDTLKERVDMRSSLASRKAGTIASVMDATQSLKEQATQLSVQEGQLADAEAAILVFDRERERTESTFINDQLSRISDAERRADEVEQRLAKARNSLEQMTLRSPIGGVIQSSAVTSVGQVVTIGQDIMRVVPEGLNSNSKFICRTKILGSSKSARKRSSNSMLSRLRDTEPFLRKFSKLRLTPFQNPMRRGEREMVVWPASPKRYSALLNELRISFSRSR